MKEGEEKNIDRKFREGLANPEEHIVYNDADWDAMEALLDERKKRVGFIFRLPFLLGVAAAMLLLALGLYFFWPDTQTNNNLTGIKRRPATDSVTSVKSQDGLQQQEEIAKKPAESVELNNHQPAENKIQQDRSNAVTDANSENTIAALGNSTKVNKSVTISTLKKRYERVNKELPNQANSAQRDLMAMAQMDTAKYDSLLAMQYRLGNLEVIKINDELAKFLAYRTEKAYNLEFRDSVMGITPVKLSGAKHPVILSVIAAPDFNGVGSAFNRTQIGTNAGLLLSVGITRKLTITTGAVYSKKPYLVGMDQYQTSYKFSTQPNDVSADCRVLDIPLNFDYQLYHKGRNLLSIGTGLSSYFMLRENYHFNYNSNYAGPSDYNISNQNKHILGVVNLNATYQRRINSKFGLNVQPYMKLPITYIGYGQVNLKSTGVAIGASWYLNTSASKK